MQPIKVEVNGKPQADGIQVVVGNTYVTYIGLETFAKLGIPVETVSDTEFIAHGVKYTAHIAPTLEPYLPWTALGVGVIPKDIPGGHNFVIPSDTPTQSSVNPPTTINGQQVVAVLDGKLNGNHFYFTAQVNGVDVDLMLDTGALRLELTTENAAKANLQDMAPAYLGGVGGSGQAGYQSVANLTLGGVDYPNTPCYVVGNEFNLLGNTFLNDNHLDVLLSNSTQKAYLLRGE